MLVGDVAQRGAAQHVRAVGKVLHRHAGHCAQAGEDRAGDGVGGVLLVGVVLDDHAAVHERAVLRVVLLRMVRVDGVCVVRRGHEAGCDGRADLAVRCAQRRACAGEHVGEERGIRALLGAAADLLVVQHGEHVDVADGLAGQERRRGGVGALEIVDARAGEEFVLGAPDAARRARVEEEVLRDDGVRVHARRPGDLGFQHAAAACAAVEREQVDLGVVLVAVVHLAVEVNGHVGDEHRVPAEIDQLRCQRIVLAHEHAARDGQRTVKPGGHDHAAVALHIQAQTAARRLVLADVLELEGRGVAVGGDDLEVRKAGLGHRERDDAGEVARHIVLAAGHDAPGLGLGQRGEAARVERVAEGLHRVKRARGLADEVEKELNMIGHGNAS